MGAHYPSKLEEVNGFGHFEATSKLTHCPPKGYCDMRGHYSNLGRRAAKAITGPGPKQPPSGIRTIATWLGDASVEDRLFSCLGYVLTGEVVQINEKCLHQK